LNRKNRQQQAGQKDNDLSQSIKCNGVKVKTAEIYPIDQRENQCGLQDQKGNTVKRARLGGGDKTHPPHGKPQHHDREHRQNIMGKNG
jgi:hypothetical protein